MPVATGELVGGRCRPCLPHAPSPLVHLDLDLADLSAETVSVKSPSGEMEARMEAGRLVFASPVTLSAGEELEIAVA